MPDAVTAEPPAEPKKSLFEKLGAGLPVALTAIATVLAGMSTSELSRAMYWRSTAAQDQGKANDQWSLAAHKRDRALMCETTAETLKAVGGYRALQPPPESLTPEIVTRVGAWMRGKGDPPVSDPAVGEVLQVVREERSDAEVFKIARKVDPARLEGHIVTALKQAFEVEDAYLQERQLAELMGQKPTLGAINFEPTRDERAAIVALRFQIDSRRYKAEATANQWVGFLYEVRVKTSTAESERHRQRSENFFFAMLAAQVGGVGSSLALARKRRSVLWLLAGIAGLAAVGFGAYVYLTM